MKTIRKISPVVFGVLIVFLHCVSPGPKRALTDKEKAVAIAYSAQEISLKLQETCKSAGKVESFNYMEDAKIRTVELGGNTAQVLYVTDRNGWKTYDVRFWKCP